MDISHIEHLGIAVKSIEEQPPYYEQDLGVKSYNIEFVADWKVKAAFFKIGRTKIERLYCLRIVCLAFHISGYAAEKRALIVAISEYPKHSGWNSIHADNDLKILIPALEKQGFMKKNILILQNEQASKSGIIQAFNLLNEKSQRNDSVFIHFSCHGQQMENDNDDEADGLDESLILYDAKMHYDSIRYKGENHLRDDEMNLYPF
jgi:hypothetical protein